MSETTTFTIVTDNEGNANLIANTKDGDVQVKGASKITLTYSNKGRAKGTKIGVTMLTPIVKSGISAMRSETFELPKELDKVLKLSEFWDNHAIQVTEEEESARKASKKAKKTDAPSDDDEDEDIEIESEEPAEVSVA